MKGVNSPYFNDLLVSNLVEGFFFVKQNLSVYPKSLGEW
jgi:hypothetical protein